MCHSPLLDTPSSFPSPSFLHTQLVPSCQPSFCPFPYHCRPEPPALMPLALSFTVKEEKGQISLKTAKTKACPSKAGERLLFLQLLGLLFLPWVQAGPCSCNAALLRLQVIRSCLDSRWFQCGEIRLLRTRSMRGGQKGAALPSVSRGEGIRVLLSISSSKLWLWHGPAASSAVRITTSQMG